MRNLFKSSLSHFNPTGLEQLRQTALFLLDESLCIVHANSHAENLLRSPAFLLQGRPVGRLFHDSRGVESLFRRDMLVHDAPRAGLPPTYLLRKAMPDRMQPLWQAHLHVLRDDQIGLFALLQVTEPRARRRTCLQP